MATTASALLQILAHAELKADDSADPGAGGTLTMEVNNGTGGRRWSQGTGSGQVDRPYMRTRSMTSGQTHSYNLLAAGSLTDALGQTIDGDELKGLVLKCLTGTIAMEAPASAFLGIFSDATDLINLSAGQAVAFDFGATGLDITSAASFDIVEKAASTATYELWLVLAQ